MPLILVQNEVTADPAHDWDDVEGVHYHYPSKYRNKIATGERFIYYVGVHRSDGRRRPHGEYFGTGLIGDIWPDPEKANSWYCSIEDYERFKEPVAAKIDGEAIETGPSNMWRDGVRVIDAAAFDRILALANLPDLEGDPRTGTEEVDYISAPVIVPREKRPPASGGGKTGNSQRNRSRRSKQIGDWGEALAIRYVREQFPGATNIVHREAVNERPGWDIDFVDEDGSLRRIEVKATTAAAFSNIVLTANEMAAAREHREAYALLLIAGCETSAPRIELITDPFGRISNDIWTAKPASFDIELG